jgi:hypothetical protein
MSVKSTFNLNLIPSAPAMTDIRNSVYLALHVDDEWECEWFIQLRRNLEDKIFNSIFAFAYELELHNINEEITERNPQES